MVLLFPALALGGEVKWKDLVERDGIYYKKFTDIPFTGNVTGIFQGKIKDGKKHGSWVWYHDNGQLYSKETFKDGKLDGPYVSYHENGQLSFKGTYKDGKKVGPWVRYHLDGRLGNKVTYKDGE